MIPSNNFNVHIDHDTDLSPLIYELTIFSSYICISIYESEEKNVWQTIRELKNNSSIMIGFYDEKRKYVRSLSGEIIDASSIIISSKKLSHNDNPAVIYQGYPKSETTKLVWEVEIPVRWDAAV